MRWVAAIITIAVVSFNASCAPPAGSEREFRNWVAADQQRAASFARFERLLTNEGVSNVVPNHELWLVDRMSAKCVTAPYAIPPTSTWRQIIPALRFIRDHVEPEIGQVRVVSAFRGDELNACVGGASQSAHRAFQALDVMPVGGAMPRAKLVEHLCALHGREGMRARIGLGIYAGRRFHIDARSYRGWGADYHGASFPCHIRRLRARETSRATIRV